MGLFESITAASIEKNLLEWSKLCFADTGWSEEELERRLEAAEVLGIGWETYLKRGYWLIPEDKLDIAHHKGQLRRDKAMDMEAHTGRDRYEIEREMIRARYTTPYHLPVTYYERLHWDEMTEEEKATILLPVHVDAIGKATRGPKNDPSLMNDKLHFYEVYKDDYGRQWFEMTQKMTKQQFIEGIKGFKTPQFLFKPKTSHGGVGIAKYSCSEDLEKVFTTLKGKNVLGKYKVALIEECLLQHPEMNRICDSTVNTVRLVTVHDPKSDEVRILYAAVKMGSGDGSAVDNVSHGGLSAGVDSETGVITTCAVDVNGKPYLKHPGSGIDLVGFQIPLWDEVKALVIRSGETAFRLAGRGQVGWDVAITPERPVLIEGNNSPDPILVQCPYWTHEKKGLRHLIVPYVGA